MNLQQLIEEHHHLHLLLDRVRVLTVAPQAALPESRWRPMLAHEVRRLGSAMTRHFAAEEQSGYMHEVMSRRPAFSRQVAALQEQHAALRDELGAIAGELVTGGAVGDARDRLRTVVSALEAHEHAEIELMQSALYDDIGCGD